MMMNQFKTVVLVVGYCLLVVGSCVVGSCVVAFVLSDRWLNRACSF